MLQRKPQYKGSSGPATVDFGATYLTGKILSSSTYISEIFLFQARHCSLTSFLLFLAQSYWVPKIICSLASSHLKLNYFQYWIVVLLPRCPQFFLVKIPTPTVMARNSDIHKDVCSRFCLYFVFSLSLNTSPALETKYMMMMLFLLSKVWDFLFFAIMSAPPSFWTTFTDLYLIYIWSDGWQNGALVLHHFTVPLQ